MSEYLCVQRDVQIRGMVKNLPLLRRAGNNSRTWVNAIICDHTYSDICIILHGNIASEQTDVSFTCH